MTASDQIARPPDNPPPGPEWKPFPDARDYESSHRGKVRSLPRTKNGRFYPGITLKLREDGDEYLMFNYTDDDGVRHHNVSVARITLLAHDPDGYRPGLQACHGPGGRQDNRWPENIRWDTPDANREEALALRLLNSPPQVKPPKVCPRCGAEHAEKGRNCHACFVSLGVDAAAGLMADPFCLRELSDRLEYPPHGLLNLAVRYGGLRFHLAGESPPTVARNSPSPGRWLRRVIIRREASRRNSDGR